MVTRFGKDEMEHRIKSENETRFGKDEMVELVRGNTNKNVEMMRCGGIGERKHK